MREKHTEAPLFRFVKVLHGTNIIQVQIGTTSLSLLLKSLEAEKKKNRFCGDAPKN